MSVFDEKLRAGLADLEGRDLLRRLRVLEGEQGPVGVLAGREVLNFSSNDYLGLAGEGFLREAFAEAVSRYGVGAGASRLISGNQAAHGELEACLAEFKRCEAAVAFGCGYSAAVGTIPALVGRGDIVILDKLCHACLVDGARLSGATLRIFPHNDVEKLASHLRWAKKTAPSGRVLVATESVFSMDGDLAPLRDIVEVKEEFGAWLMVDEAHGVGVLGEQGRGLVDTLGLNERVEVQMGTLGKALGVAGGYIAGSRALVDTLINRARSLIFSTAPPAAQAVAAACSVRWLLSPAGRDRIAALAHNRQCFAQLMNGKLRAPPDAAIVPLILGEEGTALQAAAQLLDCGIFVPAVRYPTVPRGRARLRISLSALHTHTHLRHLASQLLELSF